MYCQIKEQLERIDRRIKVTYKKGEYERVRGKQIYLSLHERTVKQMYIIGV